MWAAMPRGTKFMTTSSYRSHTTTPRRRGFTLIELLVAVAIIALLIAILLPSLTIARGRARRLVCTTNLHNIYLGVMMYKDGNGDHIPDWIAEGNWFFRRPPGMADPDDPRSLPESYGLIALLSGVRPGERSVIQDRRRYLSANSDVWHCPSAHPQMWSKYRNTYAWLKLTVPAGTATGNIPTTNYTQLMLRGKRNTTNPELGTQGWKASLMPLVQDNVGFGPGASGFRGADNWANAYKLPTYMTAGYPHAYGNKSGSSAICILWLDGNIGVGAGKAGL